MTAPGGGRRLTLALPGVLVRAAPTRAIALALLVAGAAGALTAIPAWFSGTTAAALPAALATRPAGQLGLEFSRGGSLEAGPEADPLRAVRADGDAIAASLPPSVAAIVTGRTELIDTPEYLSLRAPVQETRLAMRIMPDAAAMTRIVAGRAPTGVVGEHQIAGMLDQSGVPLMGSDLEAAISRETADELGLAVGDHVSLMPGQSINGVGLVLTITGIFEVTDAADPRWFDDATLASPVEVRAGQELTIYHAVALLDPAAYPALTPFGGAIGGPDLQYRWRFPVAVSGAASWEADRLTADLTRLQADYPFHGALAAGTPGLSSGLPGALAAFEADRDVVATAFTLAAIGPLVAGVGVLALAAGSLADRRRVPLRLLRTRGARTSRLLLAEAAAALVVVLPAAAIGTAVAAVAFRAGTSGGLTAAAATTVLGVGLLVWEAVRSLRGPAPVHLGGAPRPLLRPARARVATALVVVVALLGAVALRTASHPGGGAPAGVDGLAVPILIGIAGGILLARAFGLAVRGAARVAARTRGLALVHALRGLARSGGGRDLPLAVLVVAVTAGIVASVTATTVARSQAVAAAGQVGADYRIAARMPGGLPATLDLGALAELGPTAVVGEAAANLSSTTLASAFVGVAAIDPAAYAGVVSGTDVDPALQAALNRAAAVSGTGAAAAPSPSGSGSNTTTPVIGIVVRASLAQRVGLAPGSRLTFTAGGRPATAEVAAVLADLPGIPPKTDVVVPAAAFRAVAGSVTVPTVVLLRSGGDQAAVEQAVAAYRSQLDIASRAAVLARLGSGPLASAMRDGFALTLAVSSALAGIVVAASLLAAMGSRAREAAVLRALGLADRTARLVVVGQVAMTVAVALAAGLVLGLAVSAIAIPDLGVERMAGVAGPVVPEATVAGVALAVAGPVVVALGAIGTTLLLARGADAPARILAEEA